MLFEVLTERVQAANTLWVLELPELVVAVLIVGMVWASPVQPTLFGRWLDGGLVRATNWAGERQQCDNRNWCEFHFITPRK
jgi:hypothetical protein